MHAGAEVAAESHRLASLAIFLVGTCKSPPDNQGNRVSKPDSSQLEPTRFAHTELLDAMPDAIVIVRDDGRIANMNIKALILLGYDRGELLGEPVERLMPERFRDTHVGEREGFRRNPHVRQMGAGLEIVLQTKDGREVPVEISLAPYQTAEGPSVVCVVRPVPVE